MLNSAREKIIKVGERNLTKIKKENDEDEIHSLFIYDIYSFLDSELVNTLNYCGEDLKIPDDIKQLHRGYSQKIEDTYYRKVNSFDRRRRIEELKRSLAVKENNKKLEGILDDSSFESPEFRETEHGKIILYFVPEESRFVVGKLSYEPTQFGKQLRESDLESIRDIMRSDSYADNDNLGFHSDIERPDESVMLGGAAFYVMPDGVSVHVDFRSYGFGAIHKGLLSKCLDDNGYKLSTLDDKFFDTNDTYTTIQRMFNMLEQREERREMEEEDFMML
jgi:hypothetical protein